MLKKFITLCLPASSNAIIYIYIYILCSLLVMEFACDCSVLLLFFLSVALSILSLEFWLLLLPASVGFVLAG